MASKAAEQSIAKSREPGKPSATAVPPPAASTSRAPNSTGAEELVPETRPQAASVSGEVEAATTSLSDNLDSLQIRPEESDQIGSKRQVLLLDVSLALSVLMQHECSAFIALRPLSEWTSRRMMTLTMRMRSMPHCCLRCGRFCLWAATSPKRCAAWR